MTKLFFWMLFALMWVTGCGRSEATTKRIEQVCANVDRTNWYNPRWGTRDPRDICRDHVEQILDDRIPCTFAGLPGWCYEGKEGDLVFSRGVGALRIWVDPEERSLVEPYIVYIKPGQ